MQLDKIGVFLPCLKEETLEDGLKKVKELGLSVIQPQQFPNVVPTAEEWQELLDTCKKYGVTISGISCYQDFGNADGIEDRIEKTKACMRLAVKDLPVPIVFTEAGGTPFASDEAKAEAWKVLVPAMKELAAYAEEVGAYMAMEPGGSGLVASAESMAQLIEEVDSPRMCYNIDPANITMFGSDAVKAAKLVASHVKQAHAKDACFYYQLTPEDFGKVWGKFKTMADIGELLCRPTGPVEEVPCGEGQVDWPAFKAALDEGGFDGYWIIEREAGDNRYEDIEKAKALLETL